MIFKSIKILILSFIFSTAAHASNPEFDDYDVDENVDMAAFFIGGDNNAGSYFYIVIRTTSQCFIKSRVNIGSGGGGGGLVMLACDSLKNIPEIKNYLETGKRP